MKALFGSLEFSALKVTVPPENSLLVLDALLADLDEHAREEGRTLVFFYDEFTWFLSDLIEKEHHGPAAEILSALPVEPT